MKLRQILKYLVEENFVKQPKALLHEGVYDPGILKAIFLVGGPGSGKSYIMKQIFGIDSKTTFSSHGLKLVTPDPTFERFLKSAGISPSDLDKISTDDPDLYANTVEPLRNRAKDIEKKTQSNYIDGRLGLIIEGTGKNISSSKKYKDKLEQLGYDCFLIFVNTDLETAKARNKKRSRTIPEKALVDLWSQAQSNLGSLQQLFGAKHTMIVDNSQDSKVGLYITKAIDAFINKPVENLIGREWIRDELKKKKR